MTLGEYLSKSSPTEKQLDLIYSIEDTVGPVWEGKTKEDATKYISENIDAYIEEAKFQAELEAIVWESKHGDWGNRD